MTVMDDVQRRAENQLAALEDVQSRLDGLTIRESGDRDRVIVDVDVSGAMVGIELRPGAGNRQPAALADAIVRTSVRAATRAFADRAEIMAEFVAEFAELTGAPSEPATDSMRPTLQERR
ncbi:YbaB/EbfC family nucleoid-associated protein [Gordonia zhaorongruii]|uniref:YbaB/EbfC family nucleoid-associated protein n=1 Tax=Gordonia zhaorongruii TaxID=2597659 RepID=UPI0010526FE4|nr:YbaB/EbfC family nucleoid-associated protein [Gordonia zhaorongruii]